MFFFFNDTATTEIYTLSLHDALPISVVLARVDRLHDGQVLLAALGVLGDREVVDHGLDLSRLERLERSEEHTSELQSRQYLVCRLLLEKKNTLLPYSHCSTCHFTLSL